MQRELCAYLHDMDDAAEWIFLFTGGLQFETFDSLEMQQAAVERKFEIIGEALRQASRLYPGKLNSIPALREVINQRNHIAHGYFDVDPLILWNAIKVDLPVFQLEVRRLIELNCA